MRATSRTLAKVAALAAYLRTLPDGELAIAARLFAGRPFARSDERVLALGGSGIAAAIVERSGATEGDLGRSYHRHADLGDVAAELITDPPVGEPLSLTDVAAAFDAVAAARGSAAKRDLVRALLARAGAAEARYVVKIVSGEPRIGLREGLLESAIARAFDAERAAVARAHMVEGDIGATALRARHGRLAEARLTHFAPLGMMLASPVGDLAQVERTIAAPLVVEDKYDGMRVQIHKAAGRVEVYSRTFDRITERFPELLPALAALPGSVILDAEVVGLREGRPIPFTRFQRRLGRRSVSAALVTELPAACFVFDLLERDGEPLLDESLGERLRRLDAIPLAAPLARTERTVLDLRGDALREALEAAFAAARARGNEGLMVKDPRSPYRPGRRGAEWLKVKRALRTLDVVVTAVEWGHGRRRAMLSDYTFAVRDGDGLRNVGKAYSGLTDREITGLADHWRERTVRDLGRTLVVRPDTVIEVAFDAVQASRRHDSGFALRFPRIVRLRPDKPARDIDTLETVRALAADAPERDTAAEEDREGGPPSDERRL